MPKLSSLGGGLWEYLPPVLKRTFHSGPLREPPMIPQSFQQYFDGGGFHRAVSYDISTEINSLNVLCICRFPASHVRNVEVTTSP